MIIKESFDNYKQGYRGLKWINPSALKGRDIRTPLHFLNYFTGQQKPATGSMVLGNAIHTAVLEPEIFDERYILLEVSDFDEDCPKTLKGYPDLRDGLNKAAKLRIKYANPGKILIDPDDSDRLRGMLKGLGRDIRRENNYLNPDNGLTEHSFYSIAIFDEAGAFIKIDGSQDYIEHILGLPETSPELNNIIRVKTRLDYVHKVVSYAADLKSCQSAHPDDFSRDCAVYGYDLQAAFALEMINATWPEREFPYITFIFVCVENEPPYAAINYTASEEFLQYGRQRMINKLEWLLKCKRNKHYPGYEIFSDRVTYDEAGNVINDRQTITLDLPEYVYKKFRKF